MKILKSVSIRKMKRVKISFLYLHLLLVVLPFGIKYPPSDSSETNLNISLGHGNYASIVKGCEDSEPSDKDQFTFTDIGIQVDHLITSHVRLGIRGSYIFDEQIVEDRIESTEVTVINPFVNLEWRSLALGVGYVYNDRGLASSTRSDRLTPDVSFFLRLGDMRKFYLSTSLYNSMPLYSKAYFQFGFGGSPDPRLNLWAGMGVGPYVGSIGLGPIGIGAIGYDINRHLRLSVSAGIGEVEGIGQNSFNVGLKFRIPK